MSPRPSKKLLAAAMLQAQAPCDWPKARLAALKADSPGNSGPHSRVQTRFRVRGGKPVSGLERASSGLSEGREP